jgi:hypothetical protein
MLIGAQPSCLIKYHSDPTAVSQRGRAPVLSEQSDSDRSLELAYTAAQDMLSEQVATFARLRTRANNMLSTAALFISFSAGVGLINIDPAKGTVFRSGVALGLVLVVLVLGACVLYISWLARGWYWSPSASEMLEMVDAGQSEAAIRRHFIRVMVEKAAANEKQLAPRRRAFRGATILLLVEVLVLLVALAWR